MNLPTGDATVLSRLHKEQTDSEMQRFYGLLFLKGVDRAHYDGLITEWCQAQHHYLYPKDLHTIMDAMRNVPEKKNPKEEKDKKDKKSKRKIQ